MTLGQVLEALLATAEELNPGYEPGDDLPIDPEVKLAMQPSWPMEHSVGGVVSFDSRQEAIDTLQEAIAGLEEDERADRERLTEELAQLEASEPELTVYIGESPWAGNTYLKEGVSALLDWN
jgi:hypothetical protein